MTTTTHPDMPRPAGTEFYEEEWHQSPNGAGHYRRFATKKFPVFDGFAVATGGTQLVQDDGEAFVLRDVRVVGKPMAPLTKSQARQLALALIEAGNYVGELEAGDGGTGSS
jgi:hypothetical protein